MESFSTEKSLPLGPFEPTVILHGGAGSISRASLPPELWDRYRSSLLKYLTDARKLLESGASALDAACVAATWFEDDPLFNCGRGSVFTEQGTIEMEASVMVCSLDRAGPGAGRIKRGAAVSLVRNTRHPILLAKEVLLAADEDRGTGGTSTLHCHLSGLDVEQWGWEEKALEKKTDRWFWTRKRWEEHRRGIHPPGAYTYDDLLASVDPFASTPSEDGDIDFHEYPSQGTVGAVCLDAWGNLAVATSTGGLTNKKALTSVAGPGGELQQSAGDRWGHTGEGEGGIIGIEIVDLESGQARGDHKDRLRKKRGKAVFDFNCGGLFRAFYEADDNTGQETPRAMVFKEEY
ncbi:hypothetical protein LTR92_001088 [Exophiala xenobiotica]|nr:hypothetical protein LTR92_001088 [Exophiala xenobiotica]